MFTIGKFAEFTGIPIRTLRYYAEIGVLKPSEVDVFTNYRYYTKEDLEKAKRVLELKSLGFTLEEIRDHQDDLDVDTITQKIDELSTMKNDLEQKIIVLNTMKNKRSKEVHQLKKTA